MDSDFQIWTCVFKNVVQFLKIFLSSKNCLVSPEKLKAPTSVIVIIILIIDRSTTDIYVVLVKGRNA